MATITGDYSLVDPRVIKLINKVADETKNPAIVVTSTWRSPKDQARIMMDNLERGVRINYAWAGRQIVQLWDDNHGKMPNHKLHEIMEKRIIQLAKEGKRVSLHCVSQFDYDNVNIVDISKWINNPRDFVKALSQHDAVQKILTPYTDTTYDSTKVVKMASEPAIHLEIKTANL